MTTLREAAQQALEAWDRGLDKRPVMEALRNALAEPERDAVEVMPSSTRYTVEVEGRGRTYWDNIHDAITSAQRAVYASVDSTTRAIDDLQAGRLAEWSYGFSAVRIYPPDNSHKPPQRTKPEQEPVAWRYEAATAIFESGEYSGRRCTISEKEPCAPENSIRNLQPLYTHPAPQPVTLMDEEIENIALNLADAEIGRALKGEETNFSVEFARAVIETYQRKQEVKHEQ